MVAMACLLLTIFGAALIWKPQVFYELTESWKHDGGSEPSNLYILSTRFGGVMCALVGIGGMVCVFIGIV